MFRKTFCALLAGVGLMGLAGSAQAQFYVPHTSTHIDYVPHTTTHLDAVPYSSQRIVVGGSYPSYTRPNVYAPTVVPGYSSYRPAIRHTTTHLHVVPHRGHYHVVPHTTTHRHR